MSADMFDLCEQNFDDQEQPAPSSDGPMAWVREDLRDAQHLPTAIIAGTGAAVLWVIIWSIFTATFKLQFAWFAMGNGLLVGLAMRFYGKGINKTFGFAGLVLALGGSLLGNLLAVLILTFSEEEISFIQILSEIDLYMMVNLMLKNFYLTDILFYLIAAGTSYFLAFRRYSEDELQKIAEQY